MSFRLQAGERPGKDAGQIIPKPLMRHSTNRVNHIGRSTGEGHDEAIDFLDLEDDKVRVPRTR